jgi:hypothetical protein
MKVVTNSSALIIPPTNAPAGTNALALDIHEIKSPVVIPNAYAWLWWTLGLAAAGLIGWLLWKKYGRKLVAPKPAVVLPPHKSARDKLRSALGLLSDPYAFCTLVSGVVRVYLEERFEIHAPDRTTEEFLEEVRYSPKLEAAHKELLEVFLSRCDLVKFAKYEPTEPELRELYDAALRLIDETAPIGVTQTQAATPS